MLSDEFLEDQKKQLKELGDQLHKEAKFSEGFINNSKRPLNEKEWFSAIRSLSIFGTFQLNNLISKLDDYKEYKPEQIGFYIGKNAIQSFLDIINSYELSMNKLVNSSASLGELLGQRINEKTALIDESWNASGKSKKLKGTILNSYKNKRYEMKFTRDTLKKHSVFDNLDYKILEFSWDIRNSMHNNFCAIKDIEFSAPGTNLNYSFSFKKGEELYHPRDLKSFYSMTEQIIFIHHKTLQHFNKLDGIIE